MGNKIRTFPLKEDFMCVCAFVFVMLVVIFKIFSVGSCGMFILLLSVLCWTQILKNAADDE